jgi:NitT/TauT family transport system substrate-binding protein
MKKIRLIAEEHLTYVPHHVAENLGLFARYGLTVDVNYNSGPGGSWLADVLADGGADIARGGVWIPLMYRGRLEELRIFAQLCGRNTQVIVSREPCPNFRWSDLYGKKLLISASSTSQWMYLEGVLLENGVDLDRIKFIRDLDESTTNRLWRGGFTDFYLVYSPQAEALVRDGYHVATDIATSGGEVPWSVYYTTPAYLERNRQELEGFVRALSEAAAWIDNHSPAETAALIASDFKTVSQPVLAASVERMHSHRTWSPDMTVRPAPFARYQNMIMAYGLIEQPVAYSDILDNVAAR